MKLGAINKLVWNKHCFSTCIHCRIKPSGDKYNELDFTFCKIDNQETICTFPCRYPDKVKWAKGY